MPQSPSTGQNFTMYQGTTRTLNVSVTGLSATPSAIVWRLVLAGTTTVVLAKTLAGGGVGAASSSGFSVYLYPSDTSALASGVYNHETRVTDSSSNQDVVMVGELILNQSITQ